VIKRILIVAVLLILGTGIIARASRTEAVVLRKSLAGLPMDIGGWHGENLPEMDSRVLSVLGVDDYVNRIYYDSEKSSVGFYIGYYQSQRQGDTIHSPLNCLPGAGWNPVIRGHLRIPVGSSHEPVRGREVPGRQQIEINRIVIQKGLDRQVVLYWYQSQGRVIASEYWGKIYTVIDALRTHRTDAALVRIIAPVPGPDPQSELRSEKQAIEFVQVVFPLLHRYLPD